jgi:hypothetical protein
MTLSAGYVVGLALIMGTMLARRGWYRAHGCCQSIVVLLNPVVIAAYMVPSFRREVISGCPIPPRNLSAIDRNACAGVHSSQRTGTYPSLSF